MVQPHQVADCNWMGPIFALALALGSGNAAEPVAQIVPDVSALARQALISLPEPPVWNTPAQAPLYAFEDLESEIKRSSTSRPQMVHQAQSFIRPDLRWLKAYVKWFAKLEKPLHLKFEEETFDCDKYSRCFVAFADLLARRQGETRASVCVGWVTVSNDAGFGGVSEGGGHALVIAGTTEGLFMVEPQTGEMARFADYPNRNQLLQVNF